MSTKQKKQNKSSEDPNGTCKDDASHNIPDKHVSPEEDKVKKGDRRLPKATPKPNTKLVEYNKRMTARIGKLFKQAASGPPPPDSRLTPGEVFEDFQILPLKDIATHTEVIQARKVGGSTAKPCITAFCMLVPSFAQYVRCGLNPTVIYAMNNLLATKIAMFEVVISSENHRLNVSWNTPALHKGKLVAMGKDAKVLSPGDAPLTIRFDKYLEEGYARPVIMRDATLYSRQVPGLIIGIVERSASGVACNDDENFNNSTVCTMVTRGLAHHLHHKPGYDLKYYHKTEVPDFIVDDISDPSFFLNPVARSSVQTSKIVGPWTMIISPNEQDIDGTQVVGHLAYLGGGGETNAPVSLPIPAIEEGVIYEMTGQCVPEQITNTLENPPRQITRQYFYLRYCKRGGIDGYHFFSSYERAKNIVQNEGAVGASDLQRNMNHSIHFKIAYGPSGEDKWFSDARADTINVSAVKSKGKSQMRREYVAFREKPAKLKEVPTKKVDIV